MANLRVNERMIRIAMAQQGITTIRELSSRSGVSRPSIYKLFSGDAFRSDMVEQIAHVLKVNPLDLIESLDAPPPLVDAQGMAVAAMS